MASHSQRTVVATTTDDIVDSNKLEERVDNSTETTPARDSDSTRTCLECPVCLQPCVHPVQLPCSHVFCFLCVKGVANRSKRCALCRQEIPLSFFHNPKLVWKEDLQKTVAFEDGYQWFYEGRNGWWQYDERTSSELEEKHKLGEEKTFELLIAGFLYVIDLDSMLQYRRNDPTRRRRVKRDLVNIPEKKGIAGLRTVTAVPGNRPGAYGVETGTGKGPAGPPAGDGVSGPPSGDGVNRPPSGSGVSGPPAGDGPRDSTAADVSSASALTVVDTALGRGGTNPTPANQTLSGMLDQLRINHNGDGRSTSPAPNPAMPQASRDSTRPSSMGSPSALNVPTTHTSRPQSRRRQHRSSSRSPSVNSNILPDTSESHSGTEDSDAQEVDNSRLQSAARSLRTDEQIPREQSHGVSVRPSSRGQQKPADDDDEDTDSQVPASDESRVHQPATGRAEHPPRPRKSQQNGKQTRV